LIAQQQSRLRVSHRINFAGTRDRLGASLSVAIRDRATFLRLRCSPHTLPESRTKAAAADCVAHFRSALCTA
jgi:hypothetical protein